MVGIIEDEGSPLNALNIGAVLVTALLGGSILWNALMNQEARPELAEMPPGASARLVVSPEETPPRGTITLRFDPVVEDVQKALADSGFYTGPIDGVSGRRTKTAIESFQSANGLDVNGVPTPELAERIRFAKQIAEAAGITSSTAPATQADAQVLHVQQGLTELGYPPGPIDGTMREETREAIRAFERDRGLPETGEVSQRLLSALASTSTQSAAPQD